MYFYTEQLCITLQAEFWMKVAEIACLYFGYVPWKLEENIPLTILQWARKVYAAASEK